MPVGQAVFVAGFGSGAGKSTFCLTVIHALLDRGLQPADIGYIKPATQCESLTDVAAYCEEVGVESIYVGPVVFRKGFTATVIASDDPAGKGQELMMQITTAVTELRSRRRFVLVDGVGYPSVGACCGLGNARVAAALQIPAILIGPPGLGDCIDTFELMLTYFAAKNVHVVGAIINKMKDTERHVAKEVLPLIQRWFGTNYPDVKFLGGVPVVARLSESGDVKSPTVFASDLARSARDSTGLHAFLDGFAKSA
jgi:dethiobiotin synthetase